LNVHSIADVLALKVENILERRLPTIAFKKGIAKTPQEARQMVVHKRIKIDNRVINSPSYLVSVTEEDLLTLKKKFKPAKAEAAEQPAENAEEVKVEAQ
jgi:small subunit ribosomal protein S4